MELNDIIHGCLKGKRDAQEALVRKFGPTLLAVCNRYCNDSNMAYDALQECFISTFKYIHSYKSSGSFEGWIRKIAVNSSLKLIKKYKNFELKEDMNLLESVSNVNIPEAYIRMDIDEINYFLKKLPPSLNIVFNMYVVEGYSHKEISTVLKIGESTSRSNLARARSKLVGMLKNDSNKKSYNSILNDSNIII